MADRSYVLLVIGMCVVAVGVVVSASNQKVLRLVGEMFISLKLGSVVYLGTVSSVTMIGIAVYVGTQGSRH